MSAVGDIAVIGALGLGAVLLIHYVGPDLPSLNLGGGVPQAAGQALGYTAGSTLDSALGGAYEGYAQPISQGLCGASGGTWVGGTGGTCTNIPGPLGITPSTPVLGGVFGWLVS